MASSNETEIIEIKQEPPSPPELAEEQDFCNEDPSHSPSNANISGEQDDLPPVSDFLSVQIKEEPPSSPRNDSPPSPPSARIMHANPVPISCLTSGMAASNHAALDDSSGENDLNGDTSSSVTTSSQNEDSPSSKSIYEDIGNDIIFAMRDASRAILDNSTKLSEEINEETAFGLNVAQRLKRLKPQQRSLAQMRIYQVLYDVEFKEK